MTQVLPAIIATSYEDLCDKMSVVKGIVDLVQIDVCDGKFVPSETWPYIGDEENHFEKIITEEQEGFPFWKDMYFEADLMVSNPKESAEKWILAGAKAVVLHFESSPNIFEIIKELRNKYGYVNDSVAGVEIGVAINVDTSDDVLDQLLKLNENGKNSIDFVQFMGIDKIGYQGQKFDEKDYQKIKELRKKYPSIIISVDGGVNFDNYKDLVKAGANKLISGSAIYESENIKKAWEDMSEN